MSDSSAEWVGTFTALFLQAVERYQAGEREPERVVGPEGIVFLRTIGHTGQELFDFAEDFARGGEPTLATALAIATVRRDYFLEVQHGQASARQIALADLPGKDATVEGIGWLPRLLAKAEAKLKGEMAPELMYGCGGDRKFFTQYEIDPAEFLRRVWQAGGNHAAVVTWVKATR